MNLRYFFGAIASIPLLPVLYFQGKKVKKSIPKLPEAQQPMGMVKADSDRKHRLLCIGESTIAGVGVQDHANGFSGHLARGLSKNWNSNIEWQVIARSGYTAAQVSRKLVPKLPNEPVDIIVIGLGGNDAFTLNRPSQWRKDVRQLIANIRTKQADAPIYFTNMPPIKEFPAFTPTIKFVLGNLVEILGDELAKEVKLHENVYYYTRRINFKDWGDRLNIPIEGLEFFSDGVHPSPITYEIWAKDFANFITS